MPYTNSPMVVYTKLSPNHSGLRTLGIDRITPHCVVGQWTAEYLGDWFMNIERQASSNYGIDRDGRVALYVEEKNRSWCSSSQANDQRAVTIECASDSEAPYAFSDVVYQTLIRLCTDICRRSGKKKLLWLEDRERTLRYSPAPDEMLLTVHRWYDDKPCPGDWMFARMGDLASKVTARLADSADAPEKTAGPQAAFSGSLPADDGARETGALFPADRMKQSMSQDKRSRERSTGMYYFHGDCLKCTLKIVGDLLKAGRQKFILYPFGEQGMKVKSILNVMMGVQEYLIADNELAGRYPNIRRIDSLTQEDLKDAVVLVTSDAGTVYNDMGEPDDVYQRVRAVLYNSVPREQCVDLFPRPRQISDLKTTGEMSMDLRSFMRWTANLQSAEFAIEHLLDRPCFNNRFEMLQHIFCSEGLNDTGLLLEFGVYTGNSINFISEYHPTRPVYGFDSFEGLPENWTVDPKGMYSLGGELPAVRSNVHLIKGWFDETLPPFIGEHPEACSFIHIDCDLYSSTKTVLDLLSDRIVPGTVIVFDEFFNYPGWQQHEYRAFMEFTELHRVRFQFIGYCRNGPHVAVRILG